MNYIVFPQPKQILITGATGFLGSDVLARLIQQNFPTHSLYILCRKKPEVESSLLGLRLKKYGLTHLWNQLQFVETDFLNSQIFLKTLEQIPVTEKLSIVHLAAIIHSEDGDLTTQERMNVGVTLDLLEWASQRNAQRFVFISSVVSFGGSLTQKIRSEKDFSSGLGFLNSAFDYYKTKRSAHEKVLQFSQVPTSILCPGIVHGALENFKNSRGHLKALREGKLNIAPAGGGNIVGLDRVAASICRETLDTERKGIFTQLLVDANLEFDDYFFLHAKKKIKAVPKAAGYLALLIWIFWRKLGLHKFWRLHLLERLAQGSLYLWFESEFPEEKTAGVEKAISDSVIDL